MLLESGGLDETPNVDGKFPCYAVTGAFQGLQTADCPFVSFEPPSPLKSNLGTLETMELGNVVQSEKASVVEMEFSVVLTLWLSACTVCPARSRW